MGPQVQVHGATGTSTGAGTGTGQVRCTHDECELCRRRRAQAMNSRRVRHKGAPSAQCKELRESTTDHGDHARGDGVQPWVVGRAGPDWTDRISRDGTYVARPELEAMHIKKGRAARGWQAVGPCGR